MPCYDAPTTHAPTWALQLTVRPGDTAVGPGILTKQTWDPQKTWLTFHYSVPCHTPPCHMGIAVGESQCA